VCVSPSVGHFSHYKLVQSVHYDVADTADLAAPAVNRLCRSLLMLLLLLVMVIVVVNGRRSQHDDADPAAQRRDTHSGQSVSQRAPLATVMLPSVAAPSSSQLSLSLSRIVHDCRIVGASSSSSYTTTAPAQRASCTLNSTEAVST